MEEILNMHGSPMQFLNRTLLTFFTIVTKKCNYLPLTKKIIKKAQYVYQGLGATGAGSKNLTRLSHVCIYCVHIQKPPDNGVVFLVKHPGVVSTRIATMTKKPPSY